MRFMGMYFVFAISLLLFTACKTSAGISEKKDGPAPVDEQPAVITDYNKLLLGSWQIKQVRAGTYTMDSLDATFIFTDSYGLITKSPAEELSSSYTLRSDTILRQSELGGIEMYKILTAQPDELSIELLFQKQPIIFSLVRIK